MGGREGVAPRELKERCHFAHGRIALGIAKKAAKKRNLRKKPGEKHRN